MISSPTIKTPHSMAKTGPFDAHPDRYDDWFDRHEAALAVGRSPPRFAKGGGE